MRKCKEGCRCYDCRFLPPKTPRPRIPPKGQSPGGEIEEIAGATVGKKTFPRVYFLLQTHDGVVQCPKCGYGKVRGPTNRLDSVAANGAKCIRCGLHLHYEHFIHRAPLKLDIEDIDDVF